MTNNPKMRTLVEHISEEVTYSSSMFADIALTLSIQAYARRDWGIAWPLFVTCIQMLQRERPELATGLDPKWFKGENMIHNRIWEYVPPQQLLSLVFAAGAGTARMYTGYRNAITYFMFLRFGRTAQASQKFLFRTDANFLGALIECGVSDIGAFGEARWSGCWEEWCEALRLHGRNIADENNEEQDDSWLGSYEERSQVDLWGIIKQRSKRTGYYYSDDDSDDSDIASIVDSDWSDDSQNISPKTS
jgi:hypothetical protein